MSNDSRNAVDVVTRFAVALDEEDYPTAHALIDPACRYTLNDLTFNGPDEIVASYKGNGDTAAQKFDAISYGSAVRAGTGDDAAWTIIRFSDHLEHAGEKLDHYCEQWCQVNDAGFIARIEHRDLPGEAEALKAFKTRHGM